MCEHSAARSVSTEAARRGDRVRVEQGADEEAEIERLLSARRTTTHSAQSKHKAKLPPPTSNSRYAAIDGDLSTSYPDITI